MFSAAFFKEVDGNLAFPGTVMMSVPAALLARHYELFHFELWCIWPIFFMSLGMGFIMAWTLRGSGWWVLIPAALTLAAAGGGLAFDDFYRYQSWLRDMADKWPLWLVVMAFLVAVVIWRRRNTIRPAGSAGEIDVYT